VGEDLITYCDKTGRRCYGQSELPLLFDISSLLNKSNDIKDVMLPILELMSKYMGVRRCMITILNRETSKIYIEEGYGINREIKDNVLYSLGEGIIGEVVKTGSAIVIPDIEKDKRFLNKTGLDLSKYKEVSFICVPIKAEDDTIGSLSIHRLNDENYSFLQDNKILSIIGSLIANALKVRQDKLEEIDRLKSEYEKLNSVLKTQKNPENIIGNSGKMQEVYQLIYSVAPTNATVLIRGESGVGKELIAEAIHNHSLRKDKPFIKVNCAALPENLIESELFGHEKGSFTGADIQRKGRFELADGGTIFLDEIGDLPMQIQVKLLRVIQQREFDRVGGIKTFKTDVRIVAATNRDLENSIKDNSFREDLYYRLNVFPIYVPPLRDRKNDIPGLVDYFIEKFNKNNLKKIIRVSSTAIDLFMLYHWPGNIRELENSVERASILSSDGVIRSSNLPPTLQTAESSDTERKGNLESVIEGVERQMIIDTLISTRGNLTKTAEILGITERIMGLRIKKYQINPRQYKIGKSESGGSND